MILLDARALLHHSFHVGTDPEAISTELENDVNTAAYGFNQWMTRYMLPILEAHPPIDIIVCHDGGTDYRTALLPDYKQTSSRLDVDPEQVLQQKVMFDMMKQFWAAVGCTQAMVEGVEADDLIAYFCQKLEDPIHVYTVDVDLLQLQGQYDHVEVLLKCEHQTAGEHKGIPYNMISLSKSMIGDSSDKYGGVHGFGPKKWDMLVDSYGYDGLQELEQCVKTNNYDDILEALADGENQALRLLYDNRVEWRLGYQLASLRPELCWKPKGKKIPKIEWYRRVPSAYRAKEVLTQAGCADLLTHDSIAPWLPVMWGVENKDIDDDLFKEFELECLKSPVVAFDYETYPSENAMHKKPNGDNYVDVKEALIAGASFTFGENLNQTFYIPVNHLEADNVRVEVIGKLLRIAEKATHLVAHNEFFEIAVTKTNLDFWLQPLSDTLLMHMYVNENAHDGLKSISQAELGYKQATYAETVADPVTGEERTMDQLTMKEVLKYGCDDAVCTAGIWVLYNIIMQLEGTRQFFLENETCSVHALVDAYLNGAEINWEALATQRAADTKTVIDKSKRLRELLTENCSKVSSKRAKNLIDAEKEYITAKAKSNFLKAEEKNDPNFIASDHAEEIGTAKREALDAFKIKLLEASAYVPYESHLEPVQFIPTATKFEAVTRHLEFEPPLENVTRKGLTEWLSLVRGLNVDTKHDEQPALTARQTTFCNLLADSVEQLKARDGVEYTALVSFCEEELLSEGKEVYTGDELNTGSPPQMQALIYCKLGLPVRLQNFPDKGPLRQTLNVKGSPMTDALAIKTAMSEDTKKGDWRREALECLLAVKAAKTRESFYHKAYPAWKHPTDGRIHPQIKNCGTVTRRPAGTSPNIFAVSKHQEDAVMRSVYIPQKKGELIVSIDFDQQELRLMASESGDENLISCYIGDNPRDVHTFTGAGIAKVDYPTFLKAYNDPEHAKYKEYRGIRKLPAKKTNFLMAYLGEAPTLSRQLIIPLTEAEDFMNAAYATYPGLQPWQDSVIKFARLHGYTQTAYGNRRHLSSVLFSDKNGERRRMERQAVNAVIQGGAADILKKVLTMCWKTHLWRDTGATLLGPVYDEITSSVPIENVVEYILRLVEIMSLTPPGHVVPMEASVSLGPNWRDQKELGFHPTEDVIRGAIEEACHGS